MCSILLRKKANCFLMQKERILFRLVASEGFGSGQFILVINQMNVYNCSTSVKHAASEFLFYSRLTALILSLICVIVVTLGS